MDKNKSIDGLVTKRSKKAPVKKTTTKIKAKTTTPKTPKKPKTTTTPPQAPTESNKNTTEDFLAPVQAFNFNEENGKLEATDVNLVKKSKKAKKEKKKPTKKRKIFGIIVIIILLLLIGAVIWFILWGNDIIAKITGGQGNVFDLIFQDETYVDLKTDENGRTNILAIGTSGYNMDGEEGNGTHDGAQLTDSIMVISLNQETGDVAMLSLPRDLKASPTCTSTSKINEIYWCNGGSGDATIEEEAEANTAVMEEVGNILGLDFQYYAHLNWGSLMQIVDTLGGINITLDEDIQDYYYTGAVFEAGKEYTIDGAQAVGLARARHGTAEGDFSRGASQQKILIGIKDKVFEKNLSITDIISLASTLGDNLRTNFSVDEMKSLAHLTANFDFNNIRQLSLLEPERLMTTGTINGISYVLPVGGAGNYTKIQSFIKKSLDNDPRVYEDASILVLNATETPGVATAEQYSLEEDGFVNVSVGDTSGETFTEEYTFYALTDTAPGTKKLLEERYKVTSSSTETLPEDISRDYDFIIVIKSEE
ncbi:LCP family protein [Candidatus Saccharibacteria bacterium]|nr:LCP family protein [Candidatus Saccharibacteria bacterium]